MSNQMQSGSAADELIIEQTLQSMNTYLSAIAGDVKPLSGAGTAGTKTLTLADTWYAFPSTVPASDYILVISKEAAVGTLRLSFADVSVPSAMYGNKFTSDDLVLALAANQIVYVGSSSAADICNWTAKII